MIVVDIGNTNVVIGIYIKSKLTYIYCFETKSEKIISSIKWLFKSEKSSKRTGKAGIFAGSLELVKEGNLIIKQEKLFSDIFIKQKNE